MTTPRCRRLAQPLELGIFVDQSQRHRAPCGHAVESARLDDDPVSLDLLALAPPITSLPALELTVDELGVERDARGKALNDGGQCRPV